MNDDMKELGCVLFAGLAMIVTLGVVFVSVWGIIFYFIYLIAQIFA